MRYKPQAELSQDERDKRRARWRKASKKHWTTHGEQRNEQRRNPTRKTRKPQDPNDHPGLTSLTRSELENPTFRFIHGGNVQTEKWLARAKERENAQTDATGSPQSDAPEAPRGVAPPKLPPKLL